MRVFLLAGLVLFLGCSDESTAPVADDVKTLEDVPTDLRPVEATDTIRFEAESGDADSEDDSGAVDLPYAPPVSMDPVDGSKVSIRADTPVAEFGDRIYYFSSEDNRRVFLESPEKYRE